MPSTPKPVPSPAVGPAPSPNVPTCLVTGAAGFIGSRLTHRLLDEGWSVIGVDAFTDAYDPGEKFLRAAALTRRSGYRQIAGDLTDVPLEELLTGVQAVFHLAGRPGVRSSFRLERAYWHDNVEATERLLAAAQTVDSVRRLVYASSSSVYGDAPLPFREDAAPAPISPYGRTKLEAELRCLDANGPDLETVALRFFTVYGPGQRPDMGLRRFAEAALAGEPLRIFGDGAQTRDFTYVDDIVAGLLAARTAPVAGLAVNLGGGSRVSLLDVVAILEQILGRPLQVRHEENAPGDVRHTGADLSRARELLGFTAEVDFASGFAREVGWLRARAVAEERRAG